MSVSGAAGARVAVGLTVAVGTGGVGTRVGWTVAVGTGGFRSKLDDAHRRMGRKSSKLERNRATSP